MQRIKAVLPASPRLPVVLVLAGLLLLVVLAMLLLLWRMDRDREVATRQVQVIERALWLRGEMHALAAAEQTWRVQGLADPLLRVQRSGAEIEATLETLLELTRGDADQATHADQLRQLVSRAMASSQAALADARQAGPALGARADDAAASQLARIDTVVSALHGGATLQLKAAGERGGGRLGWAVFLLIVALVTLGLCVALLLFEARGRRRAEEEQERLQRANERAEKTAERHAHDLQRLADLGDQLRPAKSIEEVGEVLAASMKQLLPHFNGALYLQAPSRNVLRRQVLWGKPNPPLEDMFTADDCWAMRRGVSYPADPHAPPCRHLAAGTNPHHVLCAPLTAQGEVLGVMHFSGELPPNLQDRHIAQTLADQLALAVSNFRLHENLRVQSVRDPLTSLFNRRYLDATLVRECLRARRAQQSVALLLLDLDQFKQFNERHGHEAGDAALGQIGAIIAQTIRPEDIAGRHGGEEFVVILPEADADLARDRAELLRHAIRAHPIDLLGRRVEALSVSIGIALYPQHGTEPQVCLRAADRALQQAKQAGRDRVEMAEAPAGNGSKEAAKA